MPETKEEEGCLESTEKQGRKRVLQRKDAKEGRRGVSKGEDEVTAWEEWASRVGGGWAALRLKKLNVRGR